MDLKKYIFSCPHCKQIVNKDGSINLVTRRENGMLGMISMSMNIGNYTYKHNPETIFEKEEVVDFLCPSCDNNLAAINYKKFALLNMKVDNNIDFEVIFSRESGKRKTYLITEDGIETYHG